MKAATKKGAAPARSRAAHARAKKPTWVQTVADRIPLTRTQWIAAGAIAGALLLGGGGYAAWRAYTNREVDYERMMRESPALRAYQVGLVATQSGRVPEAERAFQRALSEDPSNALIYNALATLYVGNGDLAKAMVACENGIAKAPGSPDLYYTLGLVRYQTGRFDEARLALERALELREEFPDAELWLGNAYMVRSSLAGEGGDPALLTAAIDHFRRAIDLDPEVAGYHAALADGLFQRRELGEARSAMERAIELDNKNAKYWFSLGRICDQLDDLAAAEAAFVKAAERDPDNAEVHYGLGLVHFKRQRDDQAAEALRRALVLNPYHVDAHEKLGQTLIRVGRQAEGDAELQAAESSRARVSTIVEMRRASAMDPGNADLANNLGIELARQGDHEEALQMFQRALTANPKMIDPRYQIAGIYATRRKPVEAIEAFKAVDQLQPGYRRTNFYLWKLNEKIGRKNEAIRYQQLYEAQEKRGDALN